MPQLYFDKRHTVTSILTAAVSPFRFVGFDGAHATQAGGAKDPQGVAEQAGVAGQAISLVTGYSFAVEAAGAIAVGDEVAPATDGTGRAVKAAGVQFGRALTAAAGAGELVVVALAQASTGLTSAGRIAAGGLVSVAGNQPSATLAATVGTPGQVVRLSDGPDAGALLVWAIPSGSSTYTWCWWLWPQSAY